MAKVKTQIQKDMIEKHKSEWQKKEVKQLKNLYGKKFGNDALINRVLQPLENEKLAKKKLPIVNPRTQPIVKLEKGAQKIKPSRKQVPVVDIPSQSSSEEQVEISYSSGDEVRPLQAYDYENFTSYIDEQLQVKTLDIAEFSGVVFELAQDKDVQTSTSPEAIEKRQALKQLILNGSDVFLNDDYFYSNQNTGPKYLYDIKKILSIASSWNERYADVGQNQKLQNIATIAQNMEKEAYQDVQKDLYLSARQYYNEEVTYDVGPQYRQNQLTQLQRFKNLNQDKVLDLKKRLSQASKDDLKMIFNQPELLQFYEEQFKDRNNVMEQVQQVGLLKNYQDGKYDGASPAFQGLLANQLQYMVTENPQLLQLTGSIDFNEFGKIATKQLVSEIVNSTQLPRSWLDPVPKQNLDNLAQFTRDIQPHQYILQRQRHKFNNTQYQLHLAMPFHIAQKVYANDFLQLITPSELNPSSFKTDAGKDLYEKFKITEIPTLGISGTEFFVKQMGENIYAAAKANQNLMDNIRMLELPLKSGDTPLLRYQQAFKKHINMFKASENAMFEQNDLLKWLAQEEDAIETWKEVMRKDGFEVNDDLTVKELAPKNIPVQSQVMTQKQATDNFKELSQKFDESKRKTKLPIAETQLEAMEELKDAFEEKSENPFNVSTSDFKKIRKLKEISGKLNQSVSQLMNKSLSQSQHKIPFKDLERSFQGGTKRQKKALQKHQVTDEHLDKSFRALQHDSQILMDMIRTGEARDQEAIHSAINHLSYHHNELLNFMEERDQYNRLLLNPQVEGVGSMDELETKLKLKQDRLRGELTKLINTEEYQQDLQIQNLYKQLQQSIQNSQIQGNNPDTIPDNNPDRNSDRVQSQIQNSIPDNNLNNPDNNPESRLPDRVQRQIQEELKESQSSTGQLNLMSQTEDLEQEVQSMSNFLMLSNNLPKQQQKMLARKPFSQLVGQVSRADQLQFQQTVESLADSLQAQQFTQMPKLQKILEEESISNSQHSIHNSTSIINLPEYNNSDAIRETMQSILPAKLTQSIWSQQTIPINRSVAQLLDDINSNFVSKAQYDSQIKAFYSNFIEQFPAIQDAFSNAMLPENYKNIQAMQQVSNSIVNIAQLLDPEQFLPNFQRYEPLKTKNEIKALYESIANLRGEDFMSTNPIPHNPPTQQTQNPNQVPIQKAAGGEQEQQSKPEANKEEEKKEINQQPNMGNAQQPGKKLGAAGGAGGDEPSDDEDKKSNKSMQDDFHNLSQSSKKSLNKARKSSVQIPESAKVQEILAKYTENGLLKGLYTLPEFAAPLMNATKEWTQEQRDKLIGQSLNNKFGTQMIQYSRLAKDMKDVQDYFKASMGIEADDQWKVDLKKWITEQEAASKYFKRIAEVQQLPQNQVDAVNTSFNKTIKQAKEYLVKSTPRQRMSLVKADVFNFASKYDAEIQGAVMQAHFETTQQLGDLEEYKWLSRIRQLSKSLDSDKAMPSNKKSLPSDTVMQNESNMPNQTQQTFGQQTSMLQPVGDAMSTVVTNNVMLGNKIINGGMVLTEIENTIALRLGNIEAYVSKLSDASSQKHIINQLESLFEKYSQQVMMPVNYDPQKKERIDEGLLNAIDALYDLTTETFAIEKSLGKDDNPSPANLGVRASYFARKNDAFLSAYLQGTINAQATQMKDYQMPNLRQRIQERLDDQYTKQTQFKGGKPFESIVQKTFQNTLHYDGDQSLSNYMGEDQRYGQMRGRNNQTVEDISDISRVDQESDEEVQEITFPQLTEFKELTKDLQATFNKQEQHVAKLHNQLQDMISVQAQLKEKSKTKIAEMRANSDLELAKIKQNAEVELKKIQADFEQNKLSNKVVHETAATEYKHLQDKIKMEADDRFKEIKLRQEADQKKADKEAELQKQKMDNEYKKLVKDLESEQQKLRDMYNEKDKERIQANVDKQRDRDLNLSKFKLDQDMSMTQFTQKLSQSNQQFLQTQQNLLTATNKKQKHEHDLEMEKVRQLTNQLKQQADRQNDVTKHQLKLQMKQIDYQNQSMQNQSKLNMDYWKHGHDIDMATLKLNHSTILNQAENQTKQQLAQITAQQAGLVAQQQALADQNRLQHDLLMKQGELAYKSNQDKALRDLNRELNQSKIEERKFMADMNNKFSADQSLVQRNFDRDMQKIKGEATKYAADIARDTKLDYQRRQLDFNREEAKAAREHEIVLSDLDRGAKIRELQRQVELDRLHTERDKIQHEYLHEVNSRKLSLQERQMFQAREQMAQNLLSSLVVRNLQQVQDTNHEDAIRQIYGTIYAGLEQDNLNPRQNAAYPVLLGQDQVQPQPQLDKYKVQDARKLLSLAEGIAPYEPRQFAEGPPILESLAKQKNDPGTNAARKLVIDRFKTVQENVREQQRQFQDEIAVMNAIPNQNNPYYGMLNELRNNINLGGAKAFQIDVVNKLAPILTDYNKKFNYGLFVDGSDILNLVALRDVVSKGQADIRNLHGVGADYTRSIMTSTLSLISQYINGGINHNNQLHQYIDNRIGEFQTDLANQIERQEFREEEKKHQRDYEKERRLQTDAVDVKLLQFKDKLLEKMDKRGLLEKDHGGGGGNRAAAASNQFDARAKQYFGRGQQMMQRYDERGAAQEGIDRMQANENSGLRGVSSQAQRLIGKAPAITDDVKRLIAQLRIDKSTGKIVKELDDGSIVQLSQDEKDTVVEIMIETLMQIFKTFADDFNTAKMSGVDDLLKQAFGNPDNSLDQLVKLTNSIANKVTQGRFSSKSVDHYIQNIEKLQELEMQD